MVQETIRSWETRASSGRISRRLSHALSSASQGGFPTFAVLPSNIEAVESAYQFVDGAKQFVALIGPSGWGKSHLLEGTQSALRARGNSCELTSAISWVKGGNKYDSSSVLLVDDVQDIFRHPRAKYQFRLMLERRLRSRKPTMLCFNGVRMSHAMRALLPLGREWKVTKISEPGVDERELIVGQIAAAEKVQLSRPIMRLIARHLHGNGRSITGALQRLKLYRSDWSSISDICPACGILMPYLIGCEGWDPRDQVYESVNQVFERWPKVSGVTPEEITAFILHESIGITEGDVATFLSISPSSVYKRSTKIKKLNGEPLVAALVDECLATVRLNLGRV